MTSSNQQSQQWLAHMESGKQSFGRQDLLGAVNAFSAATRVQPNRIEGWINLGSSLLQTSHFKEAANALQQANALNGKVAVSHMLLGDAQRMQGKTAAALQSYQASVKLERSPTALNRLACALRSRHQRKEADALYCEALEKAPTFSLARINLATLQIENQDFEKAEQQLKSMDTAKLPAVEREEVNSSLQALGENRRLTPAINALSPRGNCSKLEALLSDLPKAVSRVDDPALSRAKAYLSQTRKMTQPKAKALQPLPDEWPWIEAMFMIPLVNDVDEYLAIRKNVGADQTLTGDMRESVNMEPAIRRARESANAMQSPASAEAQVRHWHFIAGKGVDNFHGGHFKYTRNWAARNPTLKRVDPGLASASFQWYIKNIYLKLPPGMLRAAVSFLVLCDLHCFADGNARIAMIWLNRELEWNGLMPALFHSNQGLKVDLAAGMKSARDSGDLTLLLDVIIRAQTFAEEFCAQLGRR